MNIVSEPVAPPVRENTPLTERERLIDRLRPLLAREWVAVLFLAGLAAFLLFWRLSEPPKYIYDEVYHAFTANLMTQNDPQVYEWWQTAQPNPIPGVQYEWTHPPLGKLIIAAGIWLFGNNSFGWRFFNAVWGLGCVLLIYLLARQLFQDRRLAWLAGLFLLIDGLMFAEARIGTNDIYQLGFLLAAYNCFVAFLRRPARKGLGWMLLTGICLGLAFASKWPAMYSIGLLSAIALVRGFWPEGRVRTPKASIDETAAGLMEAEETPSDMASALSDLEPGLANAWSAGTEPSPVHAISLSPLPVAQALPKPLRWGFFGRLGYLIATAVLLVGLPLALYALSYMQMYLQPHQIPVEYSQIGPMQVGPLTLGPANVGSGNWHDMFIGEQWQMWHYHTTLNDNHPYYSKWWQWLLDIRPVYYFVERGDGWVANTYALGNPLLYWGFSVAILGSLFLIWKRRQPWLAFVLAAFLINWLPWSRAPRGLFFYHFLPSVPFLVLLVVYGVMALRQQRRLLWRRLALGYIVLVCVSFAFFYTHLSAWPVPQWFADIHFWLPTWQ